MKKFFMFLAIITTLTMISGRVLAVPYFGDGGTSLQSELNKITLSPTPNESSISVKTDELPDDIDSYFSPLAVAYSDTSGGAGSIILNGGGQIIWESYTFGVYDSTNPMNKVQLFGVGATSGFEAFLSILDEGSVYVNSIDTGIDFTENSFGYYLDSAGPDGGLWYSDTSLNADGMDHMLAYQGNGDTVQINQFSATIWDEDTYILAFEDLAQPAWAGNEPNYTDFAVMVESVRPVTMQSDPIPEPSTWLLFCLGLLGIVGIKKKFD